MLHLVWERMHILDEVQYVHKVPVSTRVWLMVTTSQFETRESRYRHSRHSTLGHLEILPYHIVGSMFLHFVD